LIAIIARESRISRSVMAINKPAQNSISQPDP
jgi:hypothetical protein